MARIIGALIGGILLGAIAMYAVRSVAPAPEVPMPGSPMPGSPMPELSTSDLSTDTQAPPLHTRQPASDIDDVLALESEFRRAEALHVMAGQSDAAGVRSLIFDVDEKVATEERSAALRILFFRLTELQARSALELSQSDRFATDPVLERTVWQTWARMDLDAALFEAKTQTTRSRQKSAAQSLFAAFGDMENATVARIEAELGIAPNRSARSRYLYRLADESPAEAIDFINRVSDSRQRSEYVSWLAARLSAGDATGALHLSSLFDNQADVTRFERLLNQSIARDDPYAAMQRLTAEGLSRQNNREYVTAVQAMAKEDLDVAKQFFSEARSEEERRSLGAAIVNEMAKNDPTAALEWARANDRGEYPQMVMSALTLIARSDPQLALTEALKTRNVQMRANVVGNVVQQVAQKNPAEAAELLQQISNPQEKLVAIQHLASTWIRSDPDAAIEWIAGQDSSTLSQSILMVSSQLVRNDIDAAIRLLPRLAENDQGVLRQQIAQRLAVSRSPVDAQNFIRQFEGQPGYEQMQASVISGIAKNDVLMARQMAEQLVAGDARDRAFVQVISQHAQTDPAEAVRWLSRISNDTMRGAATGQIASQWSQNDPVAAERWASTLPVGDSRDDAIMHLSYQWQNVSASQQELIASIGNKEKRGQAKLRQIYGLIRTNPAKARELLQDDDISELQRQQLEAAISQYGLRF